MAKTLTHRERAEKAVERIRDPRGLSTEPGKTTADMIARETFPTELVEAARRALRCDWQGRGLCASCERALVDALALYPEPQEEPERE